MKKVPTHIEGSTLFAPPPYDAKLYRLLLDYCMRIMGRKSYSVRELTNKMKLKLKRMEKYNASGYLKARLHAMAGLSGEETSISPVKYDNPNASSPGMQKRNSSFFQSIDGSAEIAAVLEKLQGWGYLSDKKIIQSALENTINYKPQGPAAFMASMMKKGISKDEAKSAWAEKNIDERALATQVVKKYSQKYRKLEPQAKKRRLAGVLARKGFSGDIIWSLLAEVQ